MKSHAQWAVEYAALYLWAMRMARAAHKRAQSRVVQAWRREACLYLAKQHEHIMAQDSQ